MRARDASIGSILISVFLAGFAGCGPCNIQGLNFCGWILDAQSRPLSSGEAAFHAVWVANGVQYDSEHYGAPTAQIDSKGWACFEGGVGPSTTVREFELKSLTVQVTDENGERFEGAASHLRYRYYSNTQELDASARFVLAL